MITLIAHRGASADAPESTRAAIVRAIAAGADMVELDVQLTRDGRLVVFHDERLERTTNGGGVVARWRYRELSRLDCGAWFSPRFAGERVLLASQALRLVPPPHQVNLELKRTPRPALLIQQLIRCLRWTRSARRVLVSSFDTALLARLRAQRPRQAMAVLCRRRPGQALRKARALRCAALHPHVSLVEPSLVRRAHTAGLRVHVWTVDGLEDARRLIRMGVDGMVTNVPRRLRAVCGAPQQTRDIIRSPLLCGATSRIPTAQAVPLRGRSGATA